jgi:hypothetical protein
MKNYKGLICNIKMRGTRFIVLDKAKGMIFANEYFNTYDEAKKFIEDNEMVWESSYNADWNNIDLTNYYDRNKNMLDPYSFEDLLLEIRCNLKDINSQTVLMQARESIDAKYREAISILNANIYNIIQYAKSEREDNNV